MVTKWVTTKPISKRPKTELQQVVKDQRQQEEAERAERQRKQKEEDRKREAMRKEGKTSFTEYYENYVIPLAAKGDPEGIRLKKLHEATYNETIQQLKKEIQEAIK